MNYAFCCFSVAQYELNREDIGGFGWFDLKMSEIVLPKPFAPLCSYEESDSESEDEKQQTNETATSSACSTTEELSETCGTEFSKSSFFKLRAMELEKDSEVCVPKSKNDIRAKMRQLEMMKNAARKLNHEAVVEEDRQRKLPANWQALQKKNEWLLHEEERKQACREEGKEWDRVKLLDVQANEADRLVSRKRKKNPDTGFASFEQASYRQYDRLTRQMNVNMEEYEKHKEKVGDESLGVDSMYHGTHKPSDAAVDRMVGDLEKQIAKRAKFSRRRTFIEEKDVDYINERNAKFNKKIERFYGEYTTEIKQNLERGTAI